jgi:hypothetical protein
MVMFLSVWFWVSKELWNIYPLETGIIRRKVRVDRRPGLPLENPLTFYPRYLAYLAASHVKVARMFWRYFRIERAIRRDPKSKDYMDTALNPITNEDFVALEMYQVSEAARAAGAKAKRLAEAR